MTAKITVNREHRRPVVVEYGGDNPVHDLPGIVARTVSVALQDEAVTSITIKVTQ